MSQHPDAAADRAHLDSLRAENDARLDEPATGTPFEMKVEILGNIYFFYREQAESDDIWRKFFEWADVALPMAYLSWLGIVDIKPASHHYIKEAWTEVCGIIDVDESGSYAGLKAFFAASPNDPLDDEDDDE